MIQVKKAAVLGAGTMGAQIAAHLANAGVPTLLLDIVPKDVSEARPSGRATSESVDRNQIARAGLEAAKKSKPAAFFTKDLASLVTIGNFEDDLAKLKDCDLIIEAVVENLAIKRSLYERVEGHRKPGSVVASNTSGIPLKQLAEGRSEDFRAHFLGLHFFNPPRYMHLVEIIRTEWTKPEVSCAMFGFLDERLGKGVVVAKDRPNFIANRIGTYGALVTMRTMLDDGYSIEEVDKITGPAAGRPKTATFRTFDLVGLDVFAHVVKNLHENLPDDPEREEEKRDEREPERLEGPVPDQDPLEGKHVCDQYAASWERTSSSSRPCRRDPSPGDAANIRPRRSLREQAAERALRLEQRAPARFLAE